MRYPIAILITAACNAQNVLFEERFDQGIPSNWTQIQLGLSGDRWLPGISPLTASPDVWHEYFCVHGTLFRDNWLVTPWLDLRGLGQATLQFDDHQILPTWRFLNSVEVRVPSGNWQRIFTITRTTAGLATVAIDLAAWVGQPALQFAFHYQGDIANEWRVDNVRVTTTQPVLSVDNLRAGATAAVTVRGVSPGNVVLTGLSLAGPGPIATPFGDLWLSSPVSLMPIALAGVNGASSAALALPNGVVGLPVFGQAAELRSNGTLIWTNAVALVVQ